MTNTLTLNTATKQLRQSVDPFSRNYNNIIENFGLNYLSI